MASISFGSLPITDLNKWDIYPGISTIYSGPARALVGIAQIVSGVVLGLFSCIFGWMLNTAPLVEEAIKANFKNLCDGVGNLTRGIVATCPLIGNLVIYLYENSSLGKTVLKRNADGDYILPHVNVPGFRNMGTVRGKELDIHFGDFHIDTANGIVPSGWVLEK